MSKKIYETDAQTMADLTAGEETVWKNPRYVPFELVRGLCDLVVSETDIADAEQFVIGGQHFIRHSTKGTSSHFAPTHFGPHPMYGKAGSPYKTKRSRQGYNAAYKQCRRIGVKKQYHDGNST